MFILPFFSVFPSDDPPEHRKEPAEDEERLIRSAQQGDLDALGQLYQTYRLAAFRTAQIIIGDRHLAEDLVQEAFLRTFQAIGRLDPQRPFAPWLMRVLINRCRTALSRRGRSPSLGLPPEAGASEQGYGAAEARADLQQALRRLQPIHHDILMLHSYHRFADQEIADALGIPLGTVKSRLHHARRQLERLLEQGQPRPAPTGREGEA